MAEQNRRGVAVIAVILLLLAGTAAVWTMLVYQQTIEESSAQVQATQRPVKELVADASDDDPFYDMTIPYLREREYSSKIYNIEEHEKKNNYTAYTATYDSDGLKVNAYLAIPDGPAPEGGHPAIVFIHGYIPPTIYKTTQNYTDYVDYFAKNGFVVLKPDLRGHAESEGEPYGAYYAGEYVVDTLNAYSALQNLEDVDSNAVGLWGHSMGGNITFRSLVAKQNIPALIIWAGATYTYQDIQDYRITDNSYRPPSEDSERRERRELLNQTHGSFDKKDPFWQTVVPTNYLENVSGNIQIHHALNDGVVSIDYSKNLGNILGDYKDINFELVEYASGGHNIISPSYEKAMQTGVEFFKKYLK